MIWLRLTGTFGVHLDGETMRTSAIGSRKARTLLALLAIRLDRFVGVDEIVAAVWADEEPPRKAAANVSTLVSRLRKTLGPGVIVGDRSRYRLGGGVSVDVRRAVVLLRQAAALRARGQIAQAEPVAYRVLELLGDRTVLAEYPDAPWVEPVRTWPVALARRARAIAANAALHAGDFASARAVAEVALGEDPFDEPACRALMSAHAMAGEPARALTAYERLRTDLAEELGADPAPATRAVFLAILHGDVPSEAETPGVRVDRVRR